MVKVKINGKEHQFPTRYEDMDFRTWCNLAGARASKNYSEIIAILTGLSIEEVTGAGIEGLEILLKAIKFLQDEPVLDETPTKVGYYTFPTDIRYETVEQYQDTLNEIYRIKGLGDIKEANKALALYTAIYCQRDLKNKYDPDRAKILAETFMSYPCLEVMSAGHFFMARSQSLETGYSMSFLRQKLLLKKKQPVLRRLVRRLGFILHLTPSRGM